MGNNIFVTSISDQTVPNVILIKEAINKFGCNKFVFVTTEKMKEKNKNIQKVCNLDKDQLTELIVKSDNFTSILEDLKSLDLDEKDKLYVNLTTGTKIMSLALFEFAKNYVKTENLFYLTFGEKSFYNILTGKSFNVDTKLTVKKYFDSHGINITNIDWLESNKKRAKKRKEITYEIWNLFINSPKEVKSNSEKIRKYFQSDEVKQKENKIKFDEFKEYASFFINKLNLNLENHPKSLKNWIKYLTGGWFEELIYLKTKEYLKIENEEYIQIGLKIEHGGENELDVVVSNDNKLYYLECKTGLGKKERNILKETFYRLSHLRSPERFGKGMNNILVSLDDTVLYDSNGEIKSQYKDSVELYNLKFFGWRDIKKKGLEGIIREIFI